MSHITIVAIRMQIVVFTMFSVIATPTAVVALRLVSEVLGAFRVYPLCLFAKVVVDLCIREPLNIIMLNGMNNMKDTKDTEDMESKGIGSVEKTLLDGMVQGAVGIQWQLCGHHGSDIEEMYNIGLRHSLEQYCDQVPVGLTLLLAKASDRHSTTDLTPCTGKTWEECMVVEKVGQKKLKLFYYNTPDHSTHLLKEELV